MSYRKPSPAVGGLASSFSSSTRRASKVRERHFDEREPLRSVRVHPMWQPDAHEPDALGRLVERLELGRAVSADAWLSRGAYGAPAVYTVTPALHDALRRLLPRLEHVVGSELPPVGGRVVIKYMRLAPGRLVPSVPANREGWKAVDVSATVREAQAMRALARQCPVLGGVRRCASEVVPRLWLSGVLADPGVGLAVMQLLDGDTLASRLDSVDARLYAAVEKAVLTMWYAGVAHADLHADNVFVDPGGGAARIIDFGHALPFRAALLPAARTAAQLMRAIQTRGAWMPAVQSNLLGVGASRGLAWINPDTKLLDEVRSRVRDPQNLAAARAEAWGVPFALTSPRRTAIKRLRDALSWSSSAKMHRRKPRLS